MRTLLLLLAVLSILSLSSKANSSEININTNNALHGFCHVTESTNSYEECSVIHNSTEEKISTLSADLNKGELRLHADLVTDATSGNHVWFKVRLKPELAEGYESGTITFQMKTEGESSWQHYVNGWHTIGVRPFYTSSWGNSTGDGLRWGNTFGGDVTVPFSDELLEFSFNVFPHQLNEATNMELELYADLYCVGSRFDCKLDSKINIITSEGLTWTTANPTHLKSLTFPSDNNPPIADAGENKSIHTGVIVNLDGTGSSDDNTATGNLIYSWNIISSPESSTVNLVNATSSTPSFTPDLSGDFVIELIVTDEGGLVSEPATVTVSSENVPPNADAGEDKATVVGNTFYFDGSNSSDPDGDSITYKWKLISSPGGSASVLSDDQSMTPSLVSDMPGEYIVELIVNDGFVNSSPDTSSLTAISIEEFVQINLSNALNQVSSLSLSAVTTKGNKKALTNSIKQAITALQEGDLAEAINKIEKAIERVDGCSLRRTPDKTGIGPIKQDYITDCGNQKSTYDLLNDSLQSLNN